MECLFPQPQPFTRVHRMQFYVSEGDTMQRGNDRRMLRPFHSRDEELTPLFHALELSPDAVFVTDRSNHIVFWNESARLLLGFSDQEAVGRDCDQLLSGCDAFGNRYCSDECPVMRMANRGETVRNFLLNLRAKNGTAIVTSVSVLQLRASSPDDYLLAHVIRASDSDVHASIPQDNPPKPHVVSAKESADARARKLTAREVEVLGMLAAGRTTPEIAERLHIAQLTARSHIQNILEKLEVHSKAEAVAFAFQKNLI